MTPGCGTNKPCSEEVLKEHACFMKMKGNETFKVAVKTLSQSVVDILNRNNMSSDNIDWFVPHQANYRIIDAVARVIKMPNAKSVLTVQKYGNTSSASIPMAMNDIYEEGRLKAGDLMLLDAFGGGFTWGSAIVPFSPIY